MVATMTRPDPNGTMTAPVVYGRNEIDLAADVLWRLIDEGFVPKDRRTVTRAAQVIGVDLGELRDASIRLSVPTRYTPPRRMPMKPGGAGSGRGRPVREVPGPRPDPVRRGAPRPTHNGALWCPLHNEGEGAWLTPDSFGARTDKPQTRKWACRPCLSRYLKDRYVSVQRAQLLTGKTTIVTADIRRLFRACARCGHELLDGQEVEVADVELAHCSCPDGGTAGGATAL